MTKARAFEQFSQESRRDVLLAACVYFPDPRDRTHSLVANGGVVKVERLVVHELKSIWGADGSGGRRSAGE